MQLKDKNINKYNMLIEKYYGWLDWLIKGVAVWKFIEDYIAQKGNWVSPLTFLKAVV